MVRWTKGEAEIEQLLATGELQKIDVSAAQGAPLLEKAQSVLQSARILLESDPDSAFTLAYDAVRHALKALLAEQGLRATSKGGHYAVQQAVRAQLRYTLQDACPSGLIDQRPTAQGFPQRPPCRLRSQHPVQCR